MSPTLHLDFVSDVTCPWCAIGLHALEQAIERLRGEMTVELQLQPFELNPGMPPEGEPIVDYAARKYGASVDELAQRQALIRQRGVEVGFAFGTRTHVYGTFDAHRLLHWAGLEGRQRDLKHALLDAYHRRGENPASHDVLQRAAEAVGLDDRRARDVLVSDDYTDEVRAALRHWQQRGLHAVPSVVVDGRYLIQGGQPSEVYEQALRRIAEERDASPA